MLLIDSLYINNSGGKVLLDYLIQSLEKESFDIHYIIDERIKDNHYNVSKNKVTYLKATLYNRHKFYCENRSQVSKVLCFGNLPPTISLKVPVFTYFHQTLFLDTPSSVPLLSKLVIRVKVCILELIKHNTSCWMVQSEFIQKRLATRYKLALNDIKVLPFYPPLGDRSTILRRKDGFAYISNGGIHKNHRKLIEAFCEFYDESNRGILHLTINEQFPKILGLIEEKVSLGYPLVNHGFVDRRELVEIFSHNEYLVFPSLAESFGLGIIEAIENGCKIIGADLPYMHAVCQPSIVFDPLDVNSIKNALQESQGENVKDTIQLTVNQVDELISILRPNHQTNIK